MPASQVFDAMRVLEKSVKAEDVKKWPEILGGTRSPGRRWRLVFTSNTKQVQKALKGGPGGGMYFPLTAAQRWDATTMENENGIFLGQIAALTFKGPYSMTGKILPFNLTSLNLKLGPKVFTFPLGDKSKIKDAFDAAGPRAKSTPFFVFCYVDEDVIVARGRSGGIATWARTTPTEEVEKGIVSLP